MYVKYYGMWQKYYFKECRFVKMKLGLKIIKKIGAIAILATLTFGGYTQASAQQMPISKVEQQVNQISSGVINVGDSQTQISKILTFDEVVAAIAKSNNISKSKAANQVISNFQQSNVNTKTSLSEGLTSTVSTESATQLAQLATYRTVSSTFTVTPTYKPTLNFYCQTDEGGYFRGIVKILNISMNRSYGSLSKSFDGTVYANLEDPNRIYWIVNGDFYNNGTTSVNGGVNIGLGGSDSITFGASYTSSHYAYCYKTGYAIF